MDALCSGRRSCSLRIPDQALDITKPCPKEFKTYLEAKYTCVKGREPQRFQNLFRDLSDLMSYPHTGESKKSEVCQIE